MSEIYSIRLSNEEKTNLQQKSESLGFRSSSDFARSLIKRGLSGLSMTQKEEHLICNSAQSVMLLREVVSLLSGDKDQSLEIIKDVRSSAEDWTKKLKTSLQGGNNKPN